jgi:hypothetical protein
MASGQPGSVHLVNVSGNIYLGVDKSDKETAYLLLQEAAVGWEADGRPAILATAINTALLALVPHETSPTVTFRDAQGHRYDGWRLLETAVADIPDIVDAFSAIGYGYQRLRAMSMQAVLPGLN